MSEYGLRMKRQAELIDERLKAMYCESTLPQATLFRAMDHSLSAGGKHIRGVLTMEFCAACGGTQDAALELALAVEMLHTYSLIHDDLPCMDDDDLRRGKPTCHKVYGEANAVLAGDGLLTESFSRICGAAMLDEKTRLAAVSLLSRSAGAYGMVGGQVLDLEGESRELSLDEVCHLHGLKTGALISCAACLGVLAGGGGEARLAAAGEYGRHLGLAFQIVDDMLDVSSTSEALGKNVGSDAEHKKNSFPAMMSMESCMEFARRETDAAKQALLSAGFEPDGFLIWLADELLKREK